MSPKRQYGIERTRALLTTGEREALAGHTDANRRYQSTTRVRHRLENELPTDVDLLRKHHPELFEQLQEVVCNESE